MTKEEKLLKKAIENKSINEIKEVLSQSNKPISKEIVVPILRNLIGRSKFDFSVVEALKKRGCDLNPKLDVDYRLGDYLAYFGRLSPRLISEMGKAGYSFSSKNGKGEHAGFYLIASLPLNKKVIAALKAQGVDFNEKNNNGKTAIDLMVDVAKRYDLIHENLYLSGVCFNRFASLANTPEEIKTVSLSKGPQLKNVIQGLIDKIEPQSYENIGISELCEEIKDTLLHAQKIKSQIIPQKNVENQRIREGM